MLELLPAILGRLSLISVLPVFGMGGDLWYAAPLVVAISLVYAATRHEAMGEIVRHAARVATWIVGFMAMIFIVLALVSARL